MRKQICIECSTCGQSFLKYKAEYTRQKKKGNTRFYCCKACVNVGAADRRRKHPPVVINCPICEKPFETTKAVKAIKYCCKQCSHKASVQNRSEADKLRISSIARETARKNFKQCNRVSKPRVYTKQCVCCTDRYETKNSNKKFCSDSCARVWRFIDAPTTLRAFRDKCAFNFNLADYPDEFDFDLVREHGWYKPKNRGDNLYGVSRDHKLSVKYAFENNINPAVVSHPANCELVLHSANASKCNKCSVTLEELKTLIARWDEKYPPQQ